jgi:multidrug efflux system outer membrane protein
MDPHFFANGQAMVHIVTRKFSGIGLLLVLLNLAAYDEWFPAMNLAHRHEPSQYVVLNTWHGSNPFVESKPADGELRPDWWKLYGDPVLDKLVEAIEANPDLQAAADRFVQPAT